MNKVIVAALLILSVNCLNLKSQNFLSTGAPSYMSIEVHTVNAMAENEDDWHTVELFHKFENPVVMA